MCSLTDHTTRLLQNLIAQAQARHLRFAWSLACSGTRYQRPSEQRQVSALASTYRKSTGAARKRVSVAIWPPVGDFGSLRQCTGARECRGEAGAKVQKHHWLRQ